MFARVKHLLVVEDASVVQKLAAFSLEPELNIGKLDPVIQEVSPMFTTVRYFVKTSFAFFILGMLAGLYLYGAGIFGWTVPYTLVQAHTHLLLMGGLVMMILGIAVWFFPRARKDDQQYNPDLIRISYWVFTLATLSRFIAEILQGFFVRGVLDQVGFWSAALQILAVVSIIYSIWGRIRPVGSQIREKRGEKF